MQKSQSPTRGFVKPVPRPRSGGPELFAVLYAALWFQGALVIAASYAPRPGEYAKMSVLLALHLLCAPIVATFYPLIQDWFSGMRPAERLFIFAVVMIFFLTPLAFEKRRLLPDGFAFAVIPMLFFAADQRMARRCAAFNLIGFWAALAPWPEAPLWIVLAFGFATLLALAAIHFTFVGSPFGLRGWWPVGRIVRGALFYFIPSAVTASVVYLLWPIPAPEIPAVGKRQITAREVFQRMSELDSDDWAELAVRGGIAAFIIAVCLVCLYYIRKYLNRRMKLKNLPQIIGADLSELEWATPQAQSEKPKLTGTRGRIIQIWRRWARHHEAAGFVRASGETAAELARRIDSAAAPTPEREAITRILEAAHYAGDDPPEELVEQMKTLVDAEMAEEGRRAKRS